MRKTILLLPLAWAATARADVVPVEDGNGTVLGLHATGCGPAEARVEAGANGPGTMDQTLTVDFTGLVLEASHPLGAVTCQLDARVAVPAGMRFGIVAGAVHGYGDMKARAGSVSFRYSSPEAGAQAEARRELPAHQLSDVELTAAMDRMRFTPCRNDAGEARLHGDVALRLGPGPADDSAIRVTGQNAAYATGWDWRWMDCFQGEFASRYRAANGQVVAANISLRGDQGTYVANGGLRGQLRNVARNGRDVTGRWYAAGREGWFRFHVEDFATGRFRGRWGDERGEQGPWDGAFR